MGGGEDPLSSGANDAGDLGEDDLGVLDEGQRAIRGEGDIEAVRGEGQLAGIGEKERRGSGLGTQRVLSLRSEERRVGKEGRSRCSQEQCDRTYGETRAVTW